MKKWQIYLIAILIVLFVGIVFGWKFAGILGLIGGGGLAKKKADEIKKEQKDLKEQADNIKEESDSRKEKAEKLEKEGKKREEKAEELNEELEKTDEELEETDKKFHDMFNIIIILLISVSLIFAVQGFALAAKAEEPELNPNNFKEPNTLEEASSMIDTLLDFALKYREIAFRYKESAHEYKNLYEKEKAAKEEFKKLYEQERKATKQFTRIIDNQKLLNDKLQEIIDKLINSSGGFGIYGGVNYKILKPLESGVEAGLTLDF